MKRRIVVPGNPVDVSVIISDAMKQVVLAIPHAGEVLVVFVGSNPAGRAMTEAQAAQFHKDLKAIHEATADDVTIARMEKDFEQDG